MFKIGNTTLADSHKKRHQMVMVRNEKEVSMVEKKKVASERSRIRKGAYGWVPDVPDQRDYLLKAVLKVPAKLPASVDLRPLCSKVEDQGQLGSCTANALAGGLEFLEKKDKLPFHDFSRLFIYYNERALEHTINSDSGAMIRDGIKTLAKQGACSEKSWPYVVAKFKTKPAAACYKEASDHQITSYYRILTLDQMRTCLAEGFPFIFGFTVYESFESQQVAKTGIVSMPKKGESAMGGHAVLAVGYNDAKQTFLVKNSWGTNWGMKGYFTMPYKYVSNRNLSDDFWTIRRGEFMAAGKAGK
jgi:C1A family cysteine protease